MVKTWFRILDLGTDQGTGLATIGFWYELGHWILVRVRTLDQDIGLGHFTRILDSL